MMSSWRVDKVQPVYGVIGYVHIFHPKPVWRTTRGRRRTPMLRAFVFQRSSKTWFNNVSGV
jgi:hypothetical protein